MSYANSLVGIFWCYKHSECCRILVRRTKLGRKLDVEWCNWSFWLKRQCAWSKWGEGVWVIKVYCFWVFFHHYWKYIFRHRLPTPKARLKIIICVISAFSFRILTCVYSGCFIVHPQSQFSSNALFSEYVVCYKFPTIFEILHFS